MKPKKSTVAYWIVTVILVLFMLMDGIGGVTHQQAGVESITHLGYPEYLLTIVGVAKLAGAIAIIQNRFITIKEWAYAGFTINCIGAFLSWYFTDHFSGTTFFPLIVLLIMFLSYFLWKKLPAQQQTAVAAI